MASALQYLAVPAVRKHTATVIFVHGLGDSGHGWKPVADMFASESSLAHVKWVLPHARHQRVTANFGMTMPSWFDIGSFADFKTGEDEEGMMKSVGDLTKIIDAEVASGLRPERIIIGGFSQGAALSLLTGLTSKESRLGGVVVLSGWLPLREKFNAAMSTHATSIPVFWGHGISDPLVRLELADASVNALKSFGFTVTNGVSETKGLTYNTYSGVEHSTNLKELQDLKEWISKVLPAE
ncbi:Phospholipase/carboxylesterase [Marasmius fiardii PR-910]|nr:Phospholipase/carboxylesterase [Marasmius fiardii PR-910]